MDVSPAGVPARSSWRRPVSAISPLARCADRRRPLYRRIAGPCRNGAQESDGHTRLFVQLIDFLSIRRRPDPERFLREFLEITDVHRDTLGASDWDEELIRDHLASMKDADLDAVLDERELESLRMGYRERVTDTHLPQIAELPKVLPDLFASAAVRAKTAGFDGVELHYAHAYTMSSMLSRLNTRDDGYGGALENRLRLPLEVFGAVREALEMTSSAAGIWPMTSSTAATPSTTRVESASPSPTQG